VTVNFITQGPSLFDLIVSSVAALGSVSAVIMAVTVYRKQAGDNRSKQAARVLTFTEGPLDGGTKIQWAAQNLSDLPIYSVRYVSPIPPWDHTTHGELVDGHVVFKRIDPVSKISNAHVLTGQRDTMYVQYINHDSTAESVIEFSDAAGNRWERGSDGKLKELSKRPKRRPAARARAAKLIQWRRRVSGTRRAA
jgi:hypothetical protein